ncbi:MAG: thioredoxin family protein [Massilia sp.]|nr:thioredoxin family protein [Massilia sp.]
MSKIRNAVFLTVLFCVGCGVRAPESAGAKLTPDHSVGTTAPPFKAATMDGTPVNFPADYKGKLVMLDFWATWCDPCMAAAPAIVKVYNDAHPRGLEILGISLDKPDGAAKIREVTAEKGMTWPQVYDGKGWEGQVVALYGVEAIPAAYLIDGDTGEILATGDSLHGDKLARTVEDALAKKDKKRLN